MLLGREAEQAAVDELLRRVRSGRGQAILVHGDPGIGKSTLLDYAAGQAGGMRVLRTVGVEPELDVEYAALHRLLLPVLDRIDRIPEPQAQALRVVLGETEGPPPNRFLVALAVLSLLAEVAVERPVLCLVDDAHWCDGASLGTVTLVARRVGAEPIAVVLAAQPDEAPTLSVEGMTDVPLNGLEEDAARELLARLGGDHLSRAEQDRVLRASGGNPRALRGLSRTVPSGMDRQEPLPLAPGLQDRFLRRVRNRTAAAQRLLLLVAVERSGCVDTIRRAAVSLGWPLGPYESGELADLLVEERTRLVFRHPLIRTAVYHDAAPADRRSVHRALATALGEDPGELPRRAWHLGQAAEGPDERVAEKLERAAQQVLGRAGPGGAAASFERAAELSPCEQARTFRLRHGATAAWQAGETAHASELLHQAERLNGSSETSRPEMAELRALVDVSAGTPTDALTLLRQVIPPVLHDDRARAMPLLLTFGDIAYRTGRADLWAELAAWSDMLPRQGDDVEHVLARWIRAACRTQADTHPGLAPGDRDRVEQLADPSTLLQVAGLAWTVGDAELAPRLGRIAVRRARVLGATGTLAWALQHLVLDELLHSRIGGAEAYVEEGQRLAVETGQRNTACWYRGWLAMLAALRGRFDDATRLAHEVLADARERHLADAEMTAHRALGLVAFVTGRYDDAVGHFDVLDRSDHSFNRTPVGLSLLPNLVEAAVRTGQRDRALEAYQRFASWTQATASPHGRALLARCEAMLASGDEAEAAFRRSLELHARTDRPMGLAHAALLLGQHLRRIRRPADARPHLRTALLTFRRLGATAWADLTLAELRASGETPRPPKQTALARLTPQELRVAVAVSEGATNREIAAQMFLSPRTIDYHLRKVFQKLGITSRAELIRLMLTNTGQDDEISHPFP